MPSRKEGMLDLHIIRSSTVLRQAMDLNDLDLGLLCPFLGPPEDNLFFTWCGAFHETMEGKDLAASVKEAKGSPPASWEEVEVVVERGAERREYLRMLRSSS